MMSSATKIGTSTVTASAIASLGARVDLDELTLVADPQLGEIGVLAQLVDVDILQLTPQKIDRIARRS